MQRRIGYKAAPTASSMSFTLVPKRVGTQLFDPRERAPLDVGAPPCRSRHGVDNKSAYRKLGCTNNSCPAQELEETLEHLGIPDGTINLVRHDIGVPVWAWSHRIRDENCWVEKQLTCCGTRMCLACYMARHANVPVARFGMVCHGARSTG